jgi:hypothetical protein
MRIVSRKQRYKNGWILPLDGECGISAKLRADRNGDHFGGIDVAFWGEKIAELARGIGKSMGEFKKSKKDFEKELLLGEKKPNKISSMKFLVQKSVAS